MTSSQQQADKKTKQKQQMLLGDTFNACRGQLMKMIIFDLVKAVKLDTCYKCGEKIESAGELSVEHTESWMDAENPREVFFDLEKIAFSHLSCNKRKPAVCGTRSKYQKGCRCSECVKAESQYKSDRYNKLKTKE